MSMHDQQAAQPLLYDRELGLPCIALPHHMPHKRPLRPASGMAPFPASSPACHPATHLLQLGVQHRRVAQAQRVVQLVVDKL